MGSDAAASAENTLDVRTIDGQPYGAVMEALAALDTDETLLLINSFEPEPLYQVLENRGFEYSVSAVADDEWHVEIQATADSTDSRLLRVFSKVLSAIGR